MDYAYVVVPFAAWFIAGSIKFAANSIKTNQLAFNKIGYGGMPSNHSAIVSSITALVAIREGINHPAFGVGITIGFAFTSPLADSFIIFCTRSLG